MTLSVAKSWRLSPLSSCSMGPTGSWQGLQSVECGPTHLNSVQEQAGLPFPQPNTPGWLLLAWQTGAAANGCFQALKASWKQEVRDETTINLPHLKTDLKSRCSGYTCCEADSKRKALTYIFTLSHYTHIKITSLTSKCVIATGLIGTVDKCM